MSGFNPNKPENFGAGMACGILFILDIPFAVFSILWNVAIPNVPIRSLGIVSFREIYSDKSTLGGIIAFVLVGVGVGGWFNKNGILGPGTMSCQHVWMIASGLLALVDIIGAIYSYTYKKQRS